MRARARLRFVALGLATASCVAASSCSLALDTSADQCKVDGDCASFEGARACVAGVCLRVDADAGAAEGGDDAGPDGDSAMPNDGPSAIDAAPLPLDPTSTHERADDAVEAMLLSFWQQKLGYLSAFPASAAAATGYWTFAEAWDAVLDAVERHGGARFQGTLRTFYDAQEAYGWTSAHYDDENWMALALLRAYDLGHDPLFLAQAQSRYDDVMRAWDATCCGAAPGGIWWDQAKTQKANAVNAGAVITGARLYERTNDARYLTFASQVYAYWAANMVDPSTHQVIDHITAAGEKVAWKYSYNQGLMIGAAVALAHASGDKTALASAHAIAQFMLANETAPSASGAVLSDGDSLACAGDCPQFKGIAARYLAQLYALDKSHNEYRNLLATSGEGAWTLARDNATHLYGVDWSARSSGPLVLSATSSAAMLFSAVASIAGAAPADPADTYEAEEGVLHQLGLEASNAGYGGWGYVAGWSADGQWVDFKVNVAAAGTYDLAFRYAAGAGTATRQVFASNAEVVANEIFPGTAGWSAYSTQIVTTTLPAGSSVVSVIYNGAKGSSSFMNLDQLIIRKH
jgi:predicted alpha-1,6-mannanase (GH76 family)